jgi:predicted DNA-binding transcriptional regulator
MALLPISSSPINHTTVAVNWTVMGHLDEVTLAEVQRLLEARGLLVGQQTHNSTLSAKAKMVYGVLVRNQRAMTIRELVAATGAANSSVRVYLSELVARRMVERHQDEVGVRFSAR